MAFHFDKVIFTLGVTYSSIISITVGRQEFRKPSVNRSLPFTTRVMAKSDRATVCDFSVFVPPHPAYNCLFNAGTDNFRAYDSRINQTFIGYGRRGAHSP